MPSTSATQEGIPFIIDKKDTLRKGGNDYKMKKSNLRYYKICNAGRGNLTCYVLDCFACNDCVARILG